MLLRSIALVLFFATTLALVGCPVLTRGGRSTEAAEADDE